MKLFRTVILFLLVAFGINEARAFYDPNKGRFLSRDPIDENGGLNLYAFVENDPCDFVDPLGLSLYAFDGTNNEKDRDTKNGENTNVEILWRIYKAQGVDQKFYRNGVGTGDGIKNGLGLTGGLGFNQRVHDMFAAFESQLSQGDCTVNIVGFSRGAAEAREFANRIKAKYPHLSINWIGLFDTVESVGLPATDAARYRMNLPDTTLHGIQLVAADEHRRWFPLTSLNTADPRYIEYVMTGAHSDIGGGYSHHRGLANLALRAMWQDGIDHHVPFGDIPLEYQDFSDGRIHDSRYWWYDKPLDWVTGRGWLRGSRPRGTIYPKY